MKKNLKSTKDLEYQNIEKMSRVFKTPCRKPDLTSLNSFLASLYSVGNQATNLSLAISALKGRKFIIGYCSNIVSTGLRDLIIGLIKSGLVERVVTTAGGVEEDIIKIFDDTFICGFNQDGEYLRKNGLNRIGGVVIENNSYERFEKLLNFCIDGILDENCKKIETTPTKFLKSIGDLISKTRNLAEIVDKDPKNNKVTSVLTSCVSRNILYTPVCLTDGSFGDILSFYNDNDKIFLDIVRDFRDSMTKEEKNILIIGDGTVKNRLLSDCKKIKNLVILSTKEKYEGADMIEHKFECENEVRVYGDATVSFPLLLAGLYDNQY